MDPLAPPANLRVNDVHTPEIVRDLAARLSAGAIVNHGMDRNDLDLNRASQVRRRAPWLLELLHREVGEIAKRHGRAEVVFVHGWNNGQLKCDVGLGAVERGGDLEIPTGALLSVSRTYLRARVHALRSACVRRGIAAPVGEKYPASHPNNLVQVLAASGLPVDTLQLELSLPLRCPGPWRELFLEAVAEAFGANPGDDVPAVATAGDGDGPAQRQRLGGESLQCYDPRAGVGLFAGLGRMGANAGGRILLFLGGQRIALFTGEGRGAGGVPPLHLERRGHVLHLRFDGPILAMENAAEYLDLEAALASSRAVAARVDVEFDERQRAVGGASFGDVRGEISIEDRHHAIATEGFGHVAPLRAGGAGGQTMLAASFGPGRAFVGRLAAEDGASTASVFADGRSELVEDMDLRVVQDGDAYTPAAFELRARLHPPLRAEALNRMAILRSAPHGYLRVAFGVARFEWDAREGWGLYEHSLPLAAVKPG